MAAFNFKKLKRPTAWDTAPRCNFEGVVTGEVVRIENLKSADGAKILFRPDSEKEAWLAEKKKKAETAARDSRIPMTPEFYDVIHREEIDASHAIRIDLYISGWRYEDDGEEETDIYELLTHIRPKDRLTIRTSRNWKGKRYYPRYIYNHRTKEESGFRSESDWRQAVHPYPPYKKSGEAILSISHADKIMDDYNHIIYSLEVCENTDTDFGLYRIYLPAGTEALKTFKALDESGEYKWKNRKFLCATEYDPDVDRAYITELKEPDGSEIDAKVQKPKRVRTAKHIPYADQRRLADTFPKLPCSEYAETHGVYEAEVTDAGGMIDYRRTIRYAAFQLADGRVIMPEIKTCNGNADAENPDQEITESARGYKKLRIKKIDLIKMKKYLVPGVKVTLSFSLPQRSRFLALQSVMTEMDESELQKAREAYVEKMDREGFDPEIAKIRIAEAEKAARETGNGKNGNAVKTIPYARQRQIADTFPKLPNSEYGKTGGVYQAEVTDAGGVVDYRKPVQFAAFKLDDGRVIMPECKSMFAKLENPEPGTNLIGMRRLLTPGVKVTLHFLPSVKRTDTMILRSIITDTPIEALQMARVFYLDKMDLDGFDPEIAEARIAEAEKASADMKTSGRENGTTVIPYARQKQIADTFPRIPNSEYAETGGIYEAEVTDAGGAVDYQRTVWFAAFKLADGRTIMPELKTHYAETETAESGNDLVRMRRYLTPGIKVTLRFLPAKKRTNYMILQSAITDMPVGQLQAAHISYLDRMDKAGYDPEIANARIAEMEKAKTDTSTPEIKNNSNRKSVTRHSDIIKRKNIIKREETAKRKNTASQIPYARQKQIADTFPRLLKSEYMETGGIYEAEVTDAGGVVDYRRSVRFVAFRFSDGRVVMPELKSKFAKLKNAESETNLIGMSRFLTPGVKVTLHFQPSSKNDYMNLWSITSDSSIESLQTARISYLDKIDNNGYDPEIANARIAEAEKVKSNSPHTKNQETKKPLSYIDQKCLAYLYLRLQNSEYEKTGGVYDAVVTDADGIIDYRKTIRFAAFKLADGRTVIPQLSYVSSKKQSPDIPIRNNENKIQQVGMLTPGIPVTLYFTPSKRGSDMILRAITTTLTDWELQVARENFRAGKS